MPKIPEPIAHAEINPWDLDHYAADEIESQFCQENSDLFPALCSFSIDQYISLPNLGHLLNGTKTSPPLSDLRACIQDASCPDQQRIEALHDYVGAVYGSSGKVEYDGKLSKEERELVIQEFGELNPAEGKLQTSDLFSYLEKARRIYLDKSGFLQQRNTVCRRLNNQFVHQSYRNKILGRGEFLGGSHDGCAIEFGALYMTKGMELEVAAHPENWVFFIEGYGAIKEKVADVEFFKRIAAVLKIPIYNSTPLNTFSMEVMQKAAKKYGKPVENFLSLALTSVFFAGAIKRGLPMQVWSQALDHFTQKMGDYYKRDPQELRKIFINNLFGKTYTRDEEIEAWIELNQNFKKSYEPKLLKEERELTDQLVAVCNQENVEKIKAKLQKHSDRKEALYQAGTLHQGLVEAVYRSFH